MLIMPKRFVFFDIGAYQGEISRQYRQFLNADPSRFYLVEPNPISFPLLQDSMEGYNLFNMALSDHDGTEPYFYDPDFLNASSLYREMPAGKGGDIIETTVKCQTLDSFMKEVDVEHVDFLKLNCEGGEFKVFSAPTLDFLDHTTYLHISWHGKRTVFNDDSATLLKVKINRMLLTCGFRFLDGVRPEVIGQQGGRSHELQFWKKD